MDSPSTLATAFLGGLVAILVNEGAKKWLFRRLRSTDVARDVILDVVTTVRAVESVYDSISSTRLGEKPSRCDLVKNRSAWRVTPPVFACDRVLDGLDDQEAHRQALLYYDAINRFNEANAEHERAFFYLLDLELDRDAPLPADNPSVGERLAALSAQRESIHDAANDTLRHGYMLAAELLRIADGFSLTRFDKEHVAVLVRDHYGIDGLTLSRQAAYYGNRWVGSLYDPDLLYALVDPTLTSLPNHYCYAAVTWHRNGSPPFAVTINLRSSRVVALPVDAAVASLTICDSRDASWTRLAPKAIRISRTPFTSDRGELRIAMLPLEAGEQSSE